MIIFLAKKFFSWSKVHVQEQYDISYLVNFSFNNMSFTPIKYAGYARTVDKEQEQISVSYIN